MTSALDQQQALLDLLLPLAAAEKYKKIIEFGLELPPFPEAEKTETHLVHGCQSQLFLCTKFDGAVVYFNAHSDALISKGLAALLIRVYSGQPPDALFRHPPLFLQELNLPSLLSPARSNGLSSLIKKMQQKAAGFLSLK